MSDVGPTVTVEELVDYCQTQAGLLSGKVETMGAEADELLDEIDEAMAELSTQLEGQAGVEGTESLPSTDGPDATDVDVEAMEERQADLEEKQAVVEAKRARMQAFQNLAGDYIDLSEEIREFDDPQAALERVVEFEAEHDAPLYFDDRKTLYEAATGDESSETDTA